MKLKDCKTKEDILKFFNNDDQAFRHTNYYHYTSLGKVNSILESKQLWLNQLSKSANDLVERKNYEQFGDNVFSICFSTGTSESLPLWYLYSGIDGRGARIELRKKVFKQLINESDVYLLETQNHLPCCSVKLKTADYTITCRDILYIGEDSQKKNVYRLKHNGDALNNISKIKYDFLKANYSKFIKGLIWFYEKETRVQIEVNSELINPNKNYVVALNFEKIFDNISLCLAPEFASLDSKLFDEYKGLQNWAFSRLKKSEYVGQLNMNLKGRLCQNCTEAKNVKLNEGH